MEDLAKEMKNYQETIKKMQKSLDGPGVETQYEIEESNEKSNDEPEN